MEKKICLTGVKPTGMPHLGNYLAAIKPAIELSKSDQFDGYLFIADYHSLISTYDGKKLRDEIYEVAATWLACGLDPKQVTLYKQSDIPEILELSWILNCFCSKGLMNRAHAYKARVQDNKEEGRDEDHGVNMGLYSYPVLMSSDILFMDADVVPVGPDQLQHIEIARDLANGLNHHYGELIKLPEAYKQKIELVPGLDGRKMSKSYNNTIPLFAPEKKLKKMINKIVTDSLPPEAPKNPDDSLIMDLYKYFASKEEVKGLVTWYQKGIGWGEAKSELFKVINRELDPFREKYEFYKNSATEIDKILDDGAKKVRPIAQKNLLKIKKAIGVMS